MNLKWGPNVTVFHLIIRNICAGSGELVFENCLFIHLCIFVCLISLSESKGNMGQQRWFSTILATHIQILYLLEFFVWSGLESRCWDAEFSPSSTSLSSSIYVSINKKHQLNKTLWDTNIFGVVIFLLEKIQIHLPARELSSLHFENFMWEKQQRTF